MVSLARKREYKKELRAAKRAALEAGYYLRRQFERGHQPIVHRKGRINIVTDCDLEAQRIIHHRLMKETPGVCVIAEEGYEEPLHHPSLFWLIDPLDGTTNFLHRFPHFCVSIALVVDGTPVLGVVYDPIPRELFIALAGEGAELNGSPIQVSLTGCLDDALVASGFPYEVTEQGRDNLSTFADVAGRVCAPRCVGAAALDLCYVACGRYDAHYEFDLDPWDLAAGSLIVGEAGGTVTSVDGGPFNPFGRSVLASNPRLHDFILDLLGASRARVEPEG